MQQYLQRAHLAFLSLMQEPFTEAASSPGREESHSPEEHDFDAVMGEHIEIGQDRLGNLGGEGESSE